MNAIVTILGGWRATAFAAACLALLALVGYQRTELWSRDRTIIDLRAAADQHAAEDASAALAAQTAARATEQQQAAAFAATERQHAEELTHATETATAVADGLRTGAIRLRAELTACRATAGVSKAAAVADDDGAELRAAVARTVALGARCDAEVRRYQSMLRAER